ncbi:hypothetical protein BH09VER1_BH09VER1_47400 [soil metagenome]
MEKALYRRLIKKFHPDVTTCPRKKRLFEELSKRINLAYEVRDYDQLLAIDRAGEDFLKPHRAKSADQEWCVSENSQELLKSKGRNRKRHAPSKPAQPTLPFWRIREAFRTFICYIVNPYGLAYAMNSWNENGRIRNFLGIVGSIGWFQVVLFLWHQLGVFSEWTQLHDFPHESLGGLGIVLAKGILILAAIRIALPLAVVALYMGTTLFLCSLCCAFTMKLLGAIHPYLAWLPPVVCLGTILPLFWEALNNDFSES